MRKFLIEIDVNLLAGTLVARRWCVEWLSWSTKWMERGLMGVYVLPISVSCELHAVQAHSRLGMILWPVWLLVTLLSLWHEHRRPSQMRIWKMATWTDMRLFVAATVPVVGFGDLALPPHHWSDWVFTVSTVGLTLFHYSTSLPDVGEPGRRRKLALAKLKELFGASWVPVPQPNLSKSLFMR